MEGDEPMPVTYASYLQLDELLSLQRPRSDGPEHDEMLFIIVHQVYELWFKEVLHEFDYLSDCLGRRETPTVLHTFKRILTILKVLVAQLDILETMTPLDFLSFRDRLASGSGFQSHQFRELEFVLGHKHHDAIERFAAGTVARTALDRRWSAPTLWDAFLRYLAALGHPIPEEALARDVTAPIVPSTELQRVLIGVYRNDPETTAVCERLVDIDEGVQEWRYRHVKMVQRTIGTRTGTGGSSGAEYLLTTILKPAFPDLWAIRTEL